MPVDPADAMLAATTGGQLSPEAMADLRKAQATMRRFVAVVEADGRFPLEAFRFLQEGLDHAVKRTHGPNAGLTRSPDGSGKRVEPGTDLDEHPHHISARELCEGLLDLALLRWGRLAKAVLNGWGIERTDDFGTMVFLLVDNDLLRKTEGDRLEDFSGIFTMSEIERQYAIDIDGGIEADEVHVAGAA